MRTLASTWLPLALSFTAACGPGGKVIEGSADGASPGAGDAADDGPRCTWPASLDPTGATDGRCSASRAYLKCTYSNGTTQLCTSDSLAECPGPAQTANGTFTCEDQCQPGEYAIGCGRAGVGGTPQPAPPPPPASCRIIGGVEGVGFGCCPCGS